MRFFCFLAGVTLSHLLSSECDLKWSSFMGMSFTYSQKSVPSKKFHFGELYYKMWATLIVSFLIIHSINIICAILCMSQFITCIYFLVIRINVVKLYVSSQFQVQVRIWQSQIFRDFSQLFPNITGGSIINRPKLEACTTGGSIIYRPKLVIVQYIKS